MDFFNKNFMMKKNIIFYCHNFWWLWHIKRISLIINEILNNFWDQYKVIFLNSWEKQDFLFSKIKNIKIINLPNYSFKDYLIIDWEKISLYRQSIFTKLFSITKVESLIIEHYPFWRNFLDLEIKNLISIYKKYNDRWKVFSSLRDILDLSSLNKQNLNLFDRFLIHSDEKIKTFDSFLLDKEIERKFVYTWFVVEDSKILDKEDDIILISIWWWQDWFENILDFLEKYKSIIKDYKILVNLWLLYNLENEEKIRKLWYKNIIIKDYLEDFLEIKKKSKLIVSMWWYNNMIENVYYNKISLIYPRETDEEQKIRLNIFKDLFENIYDARKIDKELLNKILSYNLKQDNSKRFKFSWASFSSFFICNYNKYKYIKIRVTNSCNAKCEMCWVIKRSLQFNDLNNLKKSILDFYKLWWEVVNLTWWEPTIYKWFWDLLKFSKDLWLINSVSTNGSTLWEKFFLNLYFEDKKLIDYIDISIDWLNNLQDTRRKCKWLFKKIDDNLEFLIKNGINLHINVTIRKDNIWEMFDIFCYLKEKNINSISFWMITSDPFFDRKDLYPEKEDLETFFLITKNSIIQNKNDIKVVFSPDYKWWNIDEFIDFISNKNAFPKIEWNKCWFINSKKEIRINEWWDITPCCILDDYDIKLWNINKNWLLNIICSENYYDFLNRRFPYISKACLNCKLEV